MQTEIPLTNLKGKTYNDLEKSSPLSTLDSSSIISPYNPTTDLTKRKLILLLFLETFSSLAIYYNYGKLGEIYPLLAPSLLGSSTAALAQTLNQYQKKKLSVNRICKFILWGSINGCFTVLWLDLLITNFDNIAYRIFVDQLIGAPSFQLLFNILNSLWDHGEITKKTRLAFSKSLKYSFCFWPFFSICSFVLIPQAMMFPANCLAQLFWNIILSRLA